MFHIILFQPEIPPNTGNIIRLAANTGCTLHLIHPLGFVWDDKRLQRAGLDYHEWARVQHHQNLMSCLDNLDPLRCFSFTSKGTQRFTDVSFKAGDSFLFGPESRGLPEDVKDQFHPSQLLKIPQQTHARSLNLSNAVSICVYEAWRQIHFQGA